MWSIRHGFDQHVYQSVYLVERNTKLYQMLAKEHITVFSTSFVNSSINVSFSVLSSEESEKVPFASDWSCMTGLKCFIVMSGFWYLPLAKYKHYIQASAPRPFITMTNAESWLRSHLWRRKKVPQSRQMRADLGKNSRYSMKRWTLCCQNQHSTSPNTATVNKKGMLHHPYCIFSGKIGCDFCITPLLWSSSIVNEFLQ